MRLLFAISALTMMTGCASGVSQGEPDVSLVMNGSYEANTECVVSAMRRDPAAAKCGPAHLHSEKFETVGEAVVSCRSETIFGASSATAYTIAFTQADERQSRVEIWQFSTIPGVKKYSEVVLPFVQNCSMEND